MNKINAYEKNGWVNFLTDEGEECSFHKDSVSMVKVQTTSTNTRLIIETTGSSKVQIHYLDDQRDAHYIRDLITGSLDK